MTDAGWCCCRVPEDSESDDWPARRKTVKREHPLPVAPASPSQWQSSGTSMIMIEGAGDSSYKQNCIAQATGSTVTFQNSIRVRLARTEAQNLKVAVPEALRLAGSAGCPTKAPSRKSSCQWNAESGARQQDGTCHCPSHHDRDLDDDHFRVSFERFVPCLGH